MRQFLYLLLSGLILVGCDSETPDVQNPAAPQPRRDMAMPVPDMANTLPDQGLQNDLAMPIPSDATVTPDSSDAAGDVTQKPMFGDIIISEIMYDPSGVSDEHAEWVELLNTTDKALSLDDCIFADKDLLANGVETGVMLAGIEMGPEDRLLLARSNDAALNGGLNPDLVFTFALGNGGDEVLLVCDEIQVDVVRYDDGDTFPNAKGVSIVRGQDDEGMERWCPATTVYDEVNGQLGTPGQPNDACGVLMYPNCWAQIDCEDGEFCMSGQCGRPMAGCGNNADCGIGEICQDGTCIIGVPECQIDTECPASQVCESERCVPSGVMMVPEIGELIISEFMYDPHGPTDNRLDDEKAEWIELANLSDMSLDLSACTVEDNMAQPLNLGPLVIQPNGFALLARSTNPDENGGLFPQKSFTFSLNNTNTEVIRLICGDVEIDAIEFNDPTNPAQAYQRSSTNLVGATTEDSTWCGATEIYVESPEHLGTPGQPNTPCP